MSTPGFLNLGSIGILGTINLLWGLSCDLFSSISGCDPGDASSTPPASHDKQKCPQVLLNVSWGNLSPHFIGASYLCLGTQLTRHPEQTTTQGMFYR